MPGFEGFGVASGVEGELAVVGVGGAGFEGVCGALGFGHRAEGAAAEVGVCDFDVPLVAQVRLDGGVGAVGVADGVLVGALIFEEGAGLELCDDLLARFFAAEADEDVGVADVGPAVFVADGGVRRHDVDHVQLVALADVVVVGVVRGGDLQKSGRVLRLGVVAVGVRHDDVVVFHDRDDAADEGELDVVAAERLGARVIRVDGDGGVTEVGLGARGGDGDPGLFFRRVVCCAGVAAAGELVPGEGLDVRHGSESRATRSRATYEGVAQVVEVAVDFAVFDFVVGERGLRYRVPVDEALAAVDEAVFEEPEEGLAHRGGALVVHGEALAVPVAGAAHGLELFGDGGFVFVFPGLDLRHELLAAGLALRFFALVVGEGGFALGLEAAVDDGLRGDAGVVGAGHPEGLAAHHAMSADEDVLNGVVERVAEVECRGDVGGRDDDGVGGAVLRDARGVGVECAGLVPAGADGGLGLLRAVGLGEAAVGGAARGGGSRRGGLGGLARRGVRSARLPALGLLVCLDPRLCHVCSIGPGVIVVGRLGVVRGRAAGDPAGLDHAHGAVVAADADEAGAVGGRGHAGCPFPGLGDWKGEALYRGTGGMPRARQVCRFGVGWWG